MNLHTPVCHKLSLAFSTAFGSELWWSVTHSTLSLPWFATPLPTAATLPKTRPKSVTYQTILVNLDAVQLCKHHPQGSLLGFTEEKRVKSFRYVLHTRFDGSQTFQS